MSEKKETIGSPPNKCLLIVNLKFLPIFLATKMQTNTKTIGLLVWLAA